MKQFDWIHNLEGFIRLWIIILVIGNLYSQTDCSTVVAWSWRGLALNPSIQHERALLRARNGLQCILVYFDGISVIFVDFDYIKSGASREPL